MRGENNLLHFKIRLKTKCGKSHKGSEYFTNALYSNFNNQFLHSVSLSFDSSRLQVSAVALHQLHPAAVACIVGGFVVNQLESQLANKVLWRVCVSPRYNRLDYLYLNAGIMPNPQLDVKAMFAMGEMFATNLFGHFLLVSKSQVAKSKISMTQAELNVKYFSHWSKDVLDTRMN
uniref:Uncharacterized protein n=1 Tax=Oncorhynchus tshawytscha TaxID=74940 RepID=A0AAZ3PUB6_ONCTS